MAERVVKVRLTAQISEYAAAMDQAAQKTREVGSESEKLAQKREAFQALGGALTVVGGAMTALSIAVMKTGIEYNSLQQSSRAALTTLLGSAEAANAQMDKLDEFARTSPFAKQTFIQAQQQMLAFGVETQKVIPYLDAVQDAVAAAGGGNQQIEEIAFIMAQISAASKITGQDLIQFGQRGINAAELIGSQMGKTGGEIREEITAGTLDATAALDALAGGMAERFDGAAENVKNTFEGALDRVRAAWRDLSSELATPLVDPNGGGALVDFLNWTADVLRAFQRLPEPIKTTGGALFAFAGFVALTSGLVLTATPRIIAMRAAYMALGTTMRGFALAGGAAVVALTAVVAVIGAVAAAQAEAQQRAEAYAGTLEEGTNRVTAATRDMAKEALAAKNSFLWMEQDSAYDAAEKLGVSLELVTDAATGNKEAFAELERQLESGRDGSLAYENSATDIMDAVRAQSEAIGQGIEIQGQKARADEESAASSESAADAYMSAADSAAELSSQMSQLIERINEANGVGQDAVTSNAKYQAALAGISGEVQKQREEFEAANGTLDGFTASLDESTVTGSANAAMLANVASAAENAAVKQFELDSRTVGADKATQNYRTTLEAQRKAFIDSATSAGFNRTEVERLAATIFNMPTEREIQFLVDTASAQNAVDRFIFTNSGRRINLVVDGVAGRQVAGSDVIARANGGIEAYANGGFPTGIYRGGPPIHKFAEPETGWEAYISGKPSQRERNIGLWMETGRRLGVGAGESGGGGYSLPDRITLVDESGSILTHARVIASQTVAGSRRDAGVRISGGEPSL